MLPHLRANLVLLSLTLLICSTVYPLVLLGIGMGLFPVKASGSLVANADGRIVGSRLVAQEFKGDEWFHARPSAADYKGDASSGSNLSANNPKLRERVEETLKTRPGEVTADAVTASGSGLDPHITLRYARMQMERVVSTWAVKSKSGASQVRAIVEEVLKSAAFEPMSGLAGGEALINVLEVNLEIVRRLSEK